MDDILLFIFQPAILGPAMGALLTVAIKKEVAGNEKKITENNFVVRPPRTWMWAGVMMVVTSGSFMISMSLYENPRVLLVGYLAFSFFFLLGTVIALFDGAWEMKVDGKSIRLRRLLRPTKVFTFEAIKKAEIRGAPWQTLVLSLEDGKQVSIELGHMGCNLLLTRLRQENAPFQ